MEFELDDQHRLLRDTVRDFAAREVRPLAARIDEEHRIPDALVEKLAGMGFLGSYVPEEDGGAGLDMLAYAIVVEEISKACASSGVLISAHTSLACDPILRFGTPEQRRRFLPPLAAGEKVGCFLLTEPEAGSDVAAMTTRYERRDGRFVVHGGKVFITNGGYLGTGILFASGDRSKRHKGLSAFVVDLASPGVAVLKHERKMGIRGSYTTAFALDGLEIPAENLLGAEGDGFRIAMETLNGGRVGIAAQALGIAGGAFDRALAYARERRQFGAPIGDLQAIQFKLADMYTRLETSRLLTWRAAWAKDRKMPFALDSAMCKLHASETATFVTKEAVQIHGGYGFIADYEVERMYRDAKITEIYEGTSEVQRVVIARTLLGRG